jgi:hypothetical protein
VCVAEHADEQGRLAALSGTSKESVPLAITLIGVVAGLESSYAVGGFGLNPPRLDLVFFPVDRDLVQRRRPEPVSAQSPPGGSNLGT